MRYKDAMPAAKPKDAPNWSQIGRRNRTKGQAYQKHLCRKLAAHLKVPETELYSALNGVRGNDASMSRAARQRFPFSVEAKCAKTIQMPAWIAQAERQAQDEGHPFALIFKMHGKSKDYICVELDEFLQWLF